MKCLIPCLAVWQWAAPEGFQEVYILYQLNSAVVQGPIGGKEGDQARKDATVANSERC